MRTVIVIGGNGYIGSECRKQLHDNGYNVINIDRNYDNNQFEDVDWSNFSTFYLDMSKLISDRDFELIKADINGGVVHGVICFAAYKDLCESFEVPFEYYDNNLKVLLNSLDLARRVGSKTFIFSSSAGVYDDVNEICTSEMSPATGPSPYGYTKLVGERIVIDSCNQFNMRGYCLRYFNPIGKTEFSEDNSTSLFGNIKNCLETGKEAKIYGGDYETPDGTCIRDYIDIRDLISAHIFAIEQLPYKGPSTGIFNVGTGKPLTVLEVMNEVKYLQPNFKFIIDGRRAGDSAGSYADTSKLNSYGWRCRYSISESIKTLIPKIHEDPVDPY